MALRRPLRPGIDMATLIDTLNNDPRAKAPEARQPEKAPEARHPEKAHRPDKPIARKPAWIRVKAPGSAPNSCDSTRSRVNSEALKGTKGPPGRARSW